MGAHVSTPAFKKCPTSTPMVYCGVTAHFRHSAKKSVTWKKNYLQNESTWYLSEENKKISKLFPFPCIFLQETGIQRSIYSPSTLFQMKFAQVSLRSQPPCYTLHTSPWVCAFMQCRLNTAADTEQDGCSMVCGRCRSVPSSSNCGWHPDPQDWHHQEAHKELDLTEQLNHHHHQHSKPCLHHEACTHPEILLKLHF